MKNSLIKRESKDKIKGKRLRALSVILFGLIFCAVITALSFGAIFVSELFGGSSVAVTLICAGVLMLFCVISVLVYSSVSVGEKAWYGGITADKKNYRKRLYFWFRPKNSFRALRFCALLASVKLMWAAVFLLPSAIVLWSIYYLSGTGGLELYLFLSLSGGFVLLFISGLIFYFISVQRYFLSEYLFSSNPRLGAWTAIKQSKNLLDGHIHEIVRFKLSFLPWFFGCALIVPAFYFIPYYKESCCIVAKKITL